MSDQRTRIEGDSTFKKFLETSYIVYNIVWYIFKFRNMGYPYAWGLPRPQSDSKAQQRYLQ